MNLTSKAYIADQSQSVGEEHVRAVRPDLHVRAMRRFGEPAAREDSNTAAKHVAMRVQTIIVWIMIYLGGRLAVPAPSEDIVAFW